MTDSWNKTFFSHQQAGSFLASPTPVPGDETLLESINRQLRASSGGLSGGIARTGAQDPLSPELKNAYLHPRASTGVTALANVGSVISIVTTWIGYFKKADPEITKLLEDYKSALEAAKRLIESNSHYEIIIDMEYAPPPPELRSEREVELEQKKLEDPATANAFLLKGITKALHFTPQVVDKEDYGTRTSYAHKKARFAQELHDYIERLMKAISWGVMEPAEKNIIESSLTWYKDEYTKKLAGEALADVTKIRKEEDAAKTAQERSEYEQGKLAQEYEFERQREEEEMVRQKQEEKKRARQRQLDAKKEMVQLAYWYWRATQSEYEKAHRTGLDYSMQESDMRRASREYQQEQESYNRMSSESE